MIYWVPKSEPVESSHEIVASGTVGFDLDVSKDNKVKSGPKVELVDIAPECQLFAHFEAKLRFGMTQAERQDAFEKLTEHFSDMLVDGPTRYELQSYILNPLSQEEKEKEEMANMLARKIEIEIIDLTISSDEEDDESSVRVPTVPEPQPQVPAQPEPLVPLVNLPTVQPTRRSARVSVPTLKRIAATVDSLFKAEQKTTKKMKRQRMLVQPSQPNPHAQASIRPRKARRSKDPRILAMSEHEYAEFRRAINERAKQKRAQLSEAQKAQQYEYQKKYRAVAAAARGKRGQSIKNVGQIGQELIEQQRHARLAEKRERDRKRKEANPELVKAQRQMANRKYRKKMKTM